MMAARRARTDLAERLPRVRGRYDVMADLGRMTWFRVGGPAEVLYSPADVEDLAAFLKHRPADVPLNVIGLGSNMLVRDGGVPGVVIHLGKAFCAIAAESVTVTCGAGAVDASVATAARDASITGLEFLTGIPGTVGGALRMNAGAYGAEIKDVFVSATALDGEGKVHRLAAADMGFSYRHSAVAEDWIFVGAELKGTPGNPEVITQRIREIRAEREQSQPTQARTGGSTFANPPGSKAWALVDAAGCRGLVRGGAQISHKHANFLINTGTATAADLEGLGEEVRKRVKDHSGVELVWEVRRIGVAADDPDSLLRGVRPKPGGP
jgi:UDP-N-acetylmuramate dehydrogenase